MLFITGQVERVQERTAGREPNTWQEQTLVVRDWGQTLYAVVGRDFGPLPDEGTSVVLECSVNAYVNKEGKAGHGFKAHRRNSDAEASLFGSKGAGVRAAS